MEDLEDDSTLRQNVNIYFDPKKKPRNPDPDLPCISVEEMLHELSLEEPESEVAMAMD